MGTAATIPISGLERRSHFLSQLLEREQLVNSRGIPDN
jgi:hypothetical protein